jgi:hypothetical protein
VDRWVTYYRPHWSRGAGELKSTKLESEPAPRHNYSVRAATPEEIEVEVTKRESIERERRLEAEFKARPEYPEAKRVANMLDWMSPTDHPLDRLSLDEWVALRKKLEDARET